MSESEWAFILELSTNFAKFLQSRRRPLLDTNNLLFYRGVWIIEAAPVFDMSEDMKRRTNFTKNKNILVPVIFAVVAKSS